MSTDVGVQVSSSAPRRRGLRIVRDGVFFFKETPSLILSVAPPFKIESASLGFDFDTEAGWSRPQQPEHDVADFESFATAFSFSKKRRLSFSPSPLLSKSNPLRFCCGGREDRNSSRKTPPLSMDKGGVFFDEIFRLRRMNCALRTKGDSPARHTCSFCNSGSSFAHFSSAVSGFFSFYGGLFCRFSLTRVFFHIILKVRFRTLR